MSPRLFYETICRASGTLCAAEVYTPYTPLRFVWGLPNNVGGHEGGHTSHNRGVDWNGGGFMRNMADPKNGCAEMDFQQPDTYEGEFWADPSDETVDAGGVHANSGVMNYWFYLLSEGGSGTNDLGHSYDITPLGIETATEIVFNTHMNYLSPTATYQDACDATTLVAQTIYDEGTAQICADAWKAVGLDVTEGILSGIQDITTDRVSADDTIYNVLGIPVSADYKGVVIKGGKKIYNK